MLDKTRAESLLQLPMPIVTTYVNTNPAMPSNRGLAPAYLTWLKKEAKTLAASVLPSERRSFEEQLARIEEFLRNRKPQERSLVIFAGAQTWEPVPVAAEVENALHWGRPALAQLLSLQIEHKPCCVVVVDRTGARFFQYLLGELAQLEEKKFEIGVDQWKRKDIGHLAHPGIKTTRGTQRDTFEHRVDAQYGRLCRQTAELTGHLCRQKRLSRVFLVGSARLIELIEAKLPHDLRTRTVRIKEDLGRRTLAGLKPRLESLISTWEGDHAVPGWIRELKRGELKPSARHLS